MPGMNNVTGKKIDGVEYLRQRLTDVLTTPKGTRVMRREYGCDLFAGLDQTMNPGWLVQCYADIAEAVSDPVNGLTDFALDQVRPSQMSDDGAVFDLSGFYLPTGERLTLSIGGGA